MQLADQDRDEGDRQTWGERGEEIQRDFRRKESVRISEFSAQRRSGIAGVSFVS
jgi:hypothetical protein